MVKRDLCFRLFPDIYISQGSVATSLMCDGPLMICSLHDLCWVWGWNFFRKLVNICRSYGQLSRGSFCYETPCSLIRTNQSTKINTFCFQKNRLISVSRLLICIVLRIAKTDRSCRMVLHITSAFTGSWCATELLAARSPMSVSLSHQWLGLSKWVFEKPRFLWFLKPIKISKSPHLGFKILNLKTASKKSESLFFSLQFLSLAYVTNLMQIIFKYELRFVAFTWPNLCFWVVILWSAFVS